MSSQKAGLSCEGWWHQIVYGRQPMHDLRLRFSDGKVSGSGYDIVGLFTLTGSITAQGRIVMLKRYLGAHSVKYVGTYDGEGLLWGEWHIGSYKDRWMIKIEASTASSLEDAAIQEIG